MKETITRKVYVVYAKGTGHIMGIYTISFDIPQGYFNNSYWVISEQEITITLETEQSNEE